ncbi:unnamed protein product [Rotaria sordida]|uniref:G domain-containing protein n=2 Tax=Rotaria sordida TaxID=392033 RepID=A0A814W9I1_9BILA|nr:unnamed protein product [Rotaria sordida]
MAVRKMLHAVISEGSGKGSDANETTPFNIERIAIDQRGFIGSFYDGYEDNIKGKLGIKMKPQFYDAPKEMKCISINGRTPECQNLLKFVNIDHQQRLSILLEMTRATGIASLINYSQLIDKQTRLFYIYQEAYKELDKDHLHQFKKSVITSTCETFATHIITEIIWGIHLLVILQLPLNKEKEIDILLKTLKESIINNKPILTINSQQQALLDQIITTTVYSNIDDLTKIKKLQHIYEAIIELQRDDKICGRLKYILTPIQWFYDHHGIHLPKVFLCKSHEIENLEYYLLQQKSELKVLNFRVNHNLFELLQDKCQRQFNDIQEELSELQVLHMKDIERLYNVVLKIRNGTIKQSLIEKEVSLDPPKEIQQLIKNITSHMDELESKGNLMKLLQNDGFEYCNVADLGIRDGLEGNQIIDMLFGNDSHKALFFSTDKLRNDNQEIWTKLYSEMIEENKKNPQLRLVYADFTYSTYKLKKMTTTLSKDMIANQNPSNSQSSENDRKRKTPSPTPLPSSTDEFINILLLGESGVGKSTFINAFANYLHFQSLDEAQHEKPIVIIPVSFIMTINDNFDEKIIKFGEIDSNENHNDKGQSVTQKCKSYIFNISNEKKLRFIDTPGFGDTRGNQQDNLNMEEIFSFLHNISYLNGICLLFKPEILQLNSYFYSCCIQLFEYFGEKIRDYFIFCFTNARSTFFAPGNTRSFLKIFFESYPAMKIPLEKKNTFCFDSEAFRYLVAIQNSIEFDQNDRNEFEQSWLRSVTESKRFRDFLCNQHSYRKNNEWQSIQDAQFQINFMIRPILETIRNIFRNILLYNLNSSIKLSATHTIPLSMICYKCNRNPEKFDQFWILPDHIHNTLNMVSFILFLFRYYSYSRMNEF